MNTGHIFQLQSLLILFLIYLGIAKRKNRSFHVKTMVSAIIWDILLILQIEFTRSAIAKAVKVVVNPLMLNIHVSLAISCVVLYGVMFYTGRKVLKGDNNIRPWHKKFGILTAVVRTAVFATSFYAVSK